SATRCIPGELHVRHLYVAADEERHVPSGVTIVATEGVDILGQVVIDSGEPRGALTIRATAGGIVLDGRVAAIAVAAGPSTIGSIRGVHPNAAAPGSLDAGTIAISSVVGDVIIGSGAGIMTLNGLDAGTSTVQVASGVVAGAQGGHGGDVLLEAPRGAVRFMLQPGTGPICLGEGGRGEDLVVSDTLQTAGPTLEVRGGPGGVSGLLRIVAQRVLGVPTPADAVHGTQVLNDTAGCGMGGFGGNSSWDTRGGTAEYPLDAMTFVGGRGGNGIQAGGTGGFASYLSGRVVNARGTTVAKVTVQGGDGGDVGDFALVPVAGGFAGIGGAGGPVVGNAGWDGGVTASGTVYEDGAPGGDVIVRGGKGG